MSSLRKKNLREGFENLDQGSHACCIYSGKEEQLSTLSTFMKIGLERNEKCLYVFDDRTKEEIIERFIKAGIEIEDLIESGQFEFLTKRESYLKDGYFEPDKMFKLLSKVKEEALEQGFSGLRATGEMTWFFTKAPGVERLMEYESRLNEFLQGQKMVILCQYNEERFSPENLLDVIHTHPKIVINNFLYENHYYMPVEVFTTVLKGKVDEDYYRKVKSNLVKEAQLTGVKRETGREDKSLRALLQTLEKLEQTSR